MRDGSGPASVAIRVLVFDMMHLSCPTVETKVANCACSHSAGICLSIAL